MSAAPLRLRTLLGDYPVTRALKAGEIASPRVGFDYADVKPPNAAFKRVVRDLEFDVAELAIVTFLMAKAHGKPLALLPAVLIARFQHHLIVYDSARGTLDPAALAGRRIGVRSYSVTTGAWIRAILAEAYRLDPASVRWVTFEEAHVAEFRDPPSVVRAPAGANMIDMLRAGEIDAAIVPEGLALDPGIRTLIPDPAAAAAAWHARHGALQVNHMVVVRESILQRDPDAVREVYRLLLESRRAAGNPALNPFGVEPNRRNLEAAIDCVFRQQLVPRRYEVDELFGDVTRELGEAA